MFFLMYIYHECFSEHRVAFEDLPLLKSHGMLGWLSREAPGGCIIQGFYFTSCPWRAPLDDRCIVYVICASVTSSPAVRCLSEAVRSTFIIAKRLVEFNPQSPYPLLGLSDDRVFLLSNPRLFFHLLKPSRCMGESMCWSRSI